MNRLTHARSSGIKSGYWSPNKKEELVQRLAAYEDIGLDPEQIVKMDELYAEKCRELEEERRKHRWMPVEERLPENTDDVLIARQDGIVFVGWYDGECKRWFNWIGNADVLAWMPMPEAYRKEES